MSMSMNICSMNVTGGLLFSYNGPHGLDDQIYTVYKVKCARQMTAQI